MRHLNGVYTQTYNRRHGKIGHLFQGRFKAVLVEEEPYFLEVCRYVPLCGFKSGARQPRPPTRTMALEQLFGPHGPRARPTVAR